VAGISTQHQPVFPLQAKPSCGMAVAENHYIDVHSMQFTPESFQKNIELLFSMKYIDLKIEGLYPTRKNDVEFIVILKK
jgi:hypothetical protein